MTIDAPRGGTDINPEPAGLDGAGLRIAIEMHIAILVCIRDKQAALDHANLGGLVDLADKFWCEVRLAAQRLSG